jgi:hypothetical protein
MRYNKTNKTQPQRQGVRVCGKGEPVWNFGNQQRIP